MWVCPVEHPHPLAEKKPAIDRNHRTLTFTCRATDRLIESTCRSYPSIDHDSERRPPRWSPTSLPYECAGACATSRGRAESKLFDFLFRFLFKYRWQWESKCETTLQIRYYVISWQSLGIGITKVFKSNLFQSVVRFESNWLLSHWFLICFEL